MYYVALGPTFGFLLLAEAFGVPYVTNAPVQHFMVALAIVTALGSSLYASLKLRRLFREIRVLRLSWEGRVATAEELNKLMRDGFEIFHDMPCGHFNIDHVVIGPTGVFAVQTRTHASQERSATANNDHTARFDGRAIDFAGWQDRQCLEQARRHAQWLSDWLGSATGESTSVTPAIAIPGWKIDRIKGPNQQPVRVFTPREARSLVCIPTVQPLDRATMGCISRQVEQKCRQSLIETSGER